MVIEAEPRIQEEFDRNLAGYRERSAQIGDDLKATQGQIAERAKQADAKALAEREHLLSDVRSQFDKDKMEGRQRPASTWSRADEHEDGVMSLGHADDEYTPPPVAPPPLPPSAPRRPAHRAREVFEEDYSEESWLR